ncbi:MAG: type I secretion system permease/ATPase [Pseudooceanicola nanhaiensis]
MSTVTQRQRRAGSQPPVPAAGGDTSPYHAALRTLRGPVLATLGFSAVINVLMLTGSVYMLQVYDRVLTSGSVPTLLALFLIVALLFGFLFLFDVIRRRVLSRTAMRLDSAAGGAAFTQWLRSGLPQSAGMQGDARPLRDIDAVRGFLAGPAVTALFDLPFMPIFVAVLFLLHPWLGLLTLGGAGISIGLAWLSRSLTDSAIRRATEADTGARDFSEAGRQAAEAVAAMRMGGAVGMRWRGLHNRALAAAQASGDPSEALAAASRSFRMLLQSGILTLGAFLVILGEISGGMIIASSILSGRALAPLDQVIGQWHGISRAWQAHQRLSESFSRSAAGPEVVDLPEPQGRIEVKDLTKLYPGQSSEEHPPILNGITVTLEPGDGLGVIGASGSGKTTLGRLLTGAWVPDAGEVRLDGATLGQWAPDRLGRLIGYLPQRTELLPGTIRDNIARFDPDATDDEVIAAAKLGGLHEMILRLPDGYGTRIGNAAGASLSGGQLQRLGLARALFRMPKLVVLDEPNANLDFAGDAALTQAIRALREAGSVVVVMAHRPSALAAVNKILVLEHGNQVRLGSREEILGRAGKRDAAQISDPAPAPIPANAGRRLPLKVVPGNSPAANTGTRSDGPPIGPLLARRKQL